MIRISPRTTVVPSYHLHNPSISNFTLSLRANSVPLHQSSDIPFQAGVEFDLQEDCGVSIISPLPKHQLHWVEYVANLSLDIVNDALLGRNHMPGCLFFAETELYKLTFYRTIPSPHHTLT